MLIGKDISDEKKYLELTLNTVQDLLDKYVDSSNVQDKEIVKHRKFLWDNRSELDEIEINENCGQVALQEKVHASQITRIRTLEKQLKAPYFSRLDFKEDGEDVESFYIGLSSVEDEKDYNFLVFDWRSPVSTMFYDFEVGPAYYDAPARRINGEIAFSRQFNIKNGEIVFMHNSDESLCDESLTTMLGNNATDKMKNIVATIQKEQNDIIRNDDSKVLFIQGAAGSGKTSIALHRSAYLLYKHRKDLNADNILIFSPNQVFSEYISDVLPELGETNILQTTFEQYSKTFLPANFKYESKNDHLDYIYSKCEDEKAFSTRASSMEYKNTKAFMSVLNKFTPQISELITDFKPIILDDKQIISKKNVTKTFLERFSDIPFLSRIEVVKQSLFSQVETKYLSSDDNSHFDYVEDKRDFYDYCKQQVDIQVDAMIKTLNHVEIYKILWENIKKYTCEDLSSIKEITLEYLNSGEVKYEDITPIIYIRASMEGFRNYSNVKHMLIDEAQDYSPLFYEIIKRSFKNASITIMGDLNQRIDKHSNVKNKEDILTVFDNIKTVALTKCYRSTANITNFTKEILDTHEPIEAVERLGANPTIYITKPSINTKVDSLGLPMLDEALEENITNTIIEMKAKNYTSIAVICKNKSTCRLVYNKLKEKDSSVNIIDSDTSEFKLGINVISSYLAKGLEFDGVIVVDGENYLYDLDKNLFYTVCTRALHELHVFSSTDLSPVLPKDNGLYTLINQ